jgi:pimeloyl-ACP methyl ester carboxylesterase
MGDEMMDWTLDRELGTPGGTVRWTALGNGDPVVLVHGTPYSSFLWRDVAPALALSRRVYVFDHLGFGQSDQRDGQDLGLAAQARVLTRLLEHWQLVRPSLVAHDIGGAITLRALLLEGADYRDLTLFDAVSGGEWERGLFQLFLERPEVFERLPNYAHEALVSSHMRHATNIGYRPAS